MTFGKSFKHLGLSFLISKTRLFITNLHILLGFCEYRKRKCLGKYSENCKALYKYKATILLLFTEYFYQTSTEFVIQVSTLISVNNTIICSKSGTLHPPLSFPFSLPNQSLSPRECTFFSFIRVVNSWIEIQSNIAPRHSLMNLMLSHRIMSWHFNHAMLSSSSSCILTSYPLKFLQSFFGGQYLPADSVTIVSWHLLYFFNVNRLKARWIVIFRVEIKM